MSRLIMALDGHTAISDPGAEMLARWAHEKHVEDCTRCLRGDDWCPAGRRLLSSTSPHGPENGARS